MSKETNWAILGCGKIAEKFANDVQRTEGAHLYAVASRNLDNATAFKDTHSATAAYGSYEEMLQDPKITTSYPRNEYRGVTMGRGREWELPERNDSRKHSRKFVCLSIPGNYGKSHP